jgi:glycine C-acetyltransferase
VQSGRYRYENSNMEDLEQQLIKANKAGSRFKIIVTDGVFYGRSCGAFG